MAQTYNGGGGNSSGFDYFSSGTATKQAPFVQVPKAKKAAPKRAVPRPPATPRPPSGGGGTYGGGGGGGYSGGVGSNSSGRISYKAPPPATKPPAAPKPPNEAQWLLTDTAYKAQNDALTKAARDYLTQKTSQENQYNTQYTTNLSELQKQQGIDEGNTEADYAARGMGFGSGAAQKALADLIAQYKTRSGQLLTDKNTYLGNLGSAYTNFQSDQDITRAKYKQEALARRAAQLGL